MPKKITVSVTGSDNKDIWNRLESDFEVLDIDVLHVDRASYQRPLKPSRVKKIADDYDLLAAGVITVNRRPNGSLFVVDGQHRAAGALKSGESEILAQVFRGLSLEQEARLFRIKNSQIGPVSALATFRAALVEGNEEAVLVEKVVEKFGAQVNDHAIHNGNINAIGAVLWVFRSKPGGPEALENTLGVMHSALGTVGNDVVPGDLIKGVHWFLTRHPDEFEYKRLVRGIQKEGVQGLHRSATAFRMATGSGGYINWYRAILTAYNGTIRNSQHRLAEKIR